MPRSAEPFAWPTLALVLMTHLIWAASLFLPTPLAIACLAAGIALYASLQHEVIHGHPFRRQALNTALVWPAYMLVVPYARFRDTHLAHHQDSVLTDPYDDPESNYLAPAVWARLPGIARIILRLNNTLLGRILIGPVVGTTVFLWWEVKRLSRNEPGIAKGWLAHLPPLCLTLLIVALSPLPFWAYAASVYAALSILRIRTFLEHRAHEHTASRTVIIEDRGILAFLFLNNNFHVVHHMHPDVPWFHLPALYRAAPGRYLDRNQGYRYRSYADVFRRYMLRAKDPVAHPLSDR
ncbi:fatty acid desaturase [Aestuariibius insulae]|uniref:fatty acid desaturase n=1 Tax=Aestuariibius insulae TaxID=2058287 RepID=UPI00345EDE5B